MNKVEVEIFIGGKLVDTIEVDENAVAGAIDKVVAEHLEEISEWDYK